MADAQSVAEQYYEGLGRNDFAAVALLLSGDATVHVPGATLVGGQQFGGWMQAFFDAFPDLVHTHTPLEASGDTVAATVNVSGTHTGPLASPDGALEATGKSISIDARNTMRVADGRIVELTIDFDQAQFMQQLGVG